MEKSEASAPASLGRSLVLSASVASAIANKLLAPHGLGLAQWAVLSVIWRNGALSVKQIAELTGNAPPATSRIVERMVQNELLVRQADPDDRRAVVVDLNEKAEKLRPLQNIYETVNDVLTVDLTQEETETLFELLDRVRNSGKSWLEPRRDE